MPDTESIRWVKSTANELNNLLQVISESSKFLETLHRDSSDSACYFEILRGSIERAGNVTRSMAQQIGGYNGDIALLAPVPVPVPVQRTSDEVNIANPTGPRELVMIVDDEEFVTMLAGRVLTDEGYRVITARDGMQAIATYKRLRDEISLIILDYTMPVMDGADVFEELIMLNPKVPVVLSSGFAEQDKLRAMLAKGMRGFIPKPYTQQKLLTQIRATLDALQSERGAR